MIAYILTYRCFASGDGHFVSLDLQLGRDGSTNALRDSEDSEDGEDGEDSERS